LIFSTSLKKYQCATKTLKIKKQKTEALKGFGFLYRSNLFKKLSRHSLASNPV
jgi:hypothetical protein